MLKIQRLHPKTESFYHEKNKKKLKCEIVVIWFYKRIVPTVLGEPKLIKVPKIYFCLRDKEITCIDNFMCLEGNASPNEVIPTF